ncbi:MAG: hypothetical protein O8C65_08770 [Candidatus Methanoperedens sp.]|nr:hypothetical protein [Candidatus Methanoperedens sp.]
MENRNFFRKILNSLNIKEHPAKKHIDRKLIFRIRIFYVIGIILTGLMLYDVLEGIIGIELSIGGFLLGSFLGFIATRMFIIHWHEERAKVVSRFDTIGIIIMLFYVAFSISRSWLFGHWIHGSVLTAFTYSILAGIMIGRIVGMRLKIKNILSEQFISSNE